MTWMLATVTDAAEAEIAIAGGVDIIDFAGLEPGAVQDAVRKVAGRCRTSARAGALLATPEQALEAVRAVAATGVDFVRVELAPGQSLHAMAGVAWEAPLIAALGAERVEDFAVVPELAAAGFAGAVLDTADKTRHRPLDHLDVARLSQFVSLCRAKGVMAGLAGGLEAPDVPRLLELEPDFIGFRAALCHNHDRQATLDPDAVASIRRLIPQAAEKNRKAAGDRHGASGSDRVFVRDLVLEVSIGAYRHERHRPQRVRFEVVADIARRPAGDEISEVFSYDVILDTITALVANRHINLVETLAEEIAARLLQHSLVAAVSVRIEKLDVAPAVMGVEIVRHAQS